MFWIRSSHCGPCRASQEDIYDFLKEAWAKNRHIEEEKFREEAELQPERDSETGDGQADESDPSKRSKIAANQKALTMTCGLLKVFVTEAVQRAGLMAEIDGSKEIDCGHLERIVSLLFHDF